jgi:hypothetical protein
VKLFKIPTYCECCGARLELRRDFLSTFPSKVLFLSGALLLGSTLSDTLASLGVSEHGVSRPLIDLAIGAGYYFTCRLIFSFFHVRKWFRGDAKGIKNQTDRVAVRRCASCKPSRVKHLVS